MTDGGDAGGEQIRALTFGSVAEDYERYRIGYPDEVVDVIEEYAARPLRSALEVGAGTGKATRVFVARRLEVTALEPDAEMARVLGRTTRGVTPVVTTFEQFRTDQTFDLVYAAAAWHWTNRDTRWSRAVELLVPGGVLALFGSLADVADPDLLAAVEEIERQVLDQDGADAFHPWSVEEMQATDGLVDVVERHLPQIMPTTADDYVGRLATVSAYLVLAPAARRDALDRVRAVLPARFDVDATMKLSLARRA